MIEDNASILQEYYMGIDPSTTSTGYAILDKDGNLVDYGVFKTDDSDMSDAQKLAHQYEQLRVLMLKYNSSEFDADGGWIRDNTLVGIGIEDQFQGPNVKTLIQIARMASVFMTQAALTNAELAMFYPKSWRLLFHGNGKAVKRDTIKLVNEMHGLSLKGKDNDIADAIGIAHAMRIKCQGMCPDINTKKKDVGTGGQS